MTQNYLDVVIMRLPIVNLEFGSESKGIEVIELAKVIVKEYVTPDEGLKLICAIRGHLEAHILGRTREGDVFYDAGGLVDIFRYDDIQYYTAKK